MVIVIASIFGGSPRDWSIAMVAFKTIVRPLLCAGLLLGLIGCRAKPAPDSGFLQQPALLKPDKDIPFNRVYANPTYHDKAYVEIYVAPVNTDYVMAQNIWEKATLAEVDPQNVKNNVHLLAEYLRNAFIKAAQNDPTKKFKVVDKPGPNTLILEMALVQLVPSKAELQAIGFVSWIPTAVMLGSSVATNSEDQGKGVVAFEARTRDGTTGEVSAMFADREHPPTAIVDLKSLFWWEPAKPICDAWARQFMAIQTNPKGKKIEEIPNFQLLVW
jgi:hypothetical protein